MSFKIGSMISSFIKKVEDKVVDVEKTVEKDVGQVAKQAEQAVDSFETNVKNTVNNAVKSIQSNETVQEAEHFLGATVDSFERAVGLKPTNPEPSPVSNVPWTPNTAPLFVDGPQASDIKQGATGDCYFLSSLASLANTHPDLVKQAITENKDGTYTVTFHVPPGFDAMKAFGPLGGLAEGGLVKLADNMGYNPKDQTIQITVDNTLPGANPNYPEYSKLSDTGEKWVPIMEKAYAKLWGTYGDIGYGGDPATALYALTGKGSHSIGLAKGLDSFGYKVNTNTLSAKELDSVWNQLSDAAKNGKPMVACTYMGELGGPKMDGIIDGHAYSLLGVTEHDGQRFVILRNPWGSTEPGNDGKNDGVFELPLDKFAQQYTGVTVSDM
jgi:hypothetical protein